MPKSGLATCDGGPVMRRKQSKQNTRMQRVRSSAKCLMLRASLLLGCAIGCDWLAGDISRKREREREVSASRRDSVARNNTRGAQSAAIEGRLMAMARAEDRGGGWWLPGASSPRLDSTEPTTPRGAKPSQPGPVQPSYPIRPHARLSLFRCPPTAARAAATGGGFQSLHPVCRCASVRPPDAPGQRRTTVVYCL